MPTTPRKAATRRCYSGTIMPPVSASDPRRSEIRPTPVFCQRDPPPRGDPRRRLFLRPEHDALRMIAKGGSIRPEPPRKRPAGELRASRRGARKACPIALLFGPPACRCRLLGGGGPRCRWASGRPGTAQPANVPGRTFVGGLAFTRSALFSAPGYFVDRGPRAAFGFPFRHAALLVALLNMLSLPFLLVRILRFITSRHNASSSSK